MVSLDGYFLYFLFALPALLLGLWAQFKVKSAINTYSRVRTAIGMSGAQIARRILDGNGLTNVRVEETRGMLSDHYDPRSKTLRLSAEVFRGNSIASAGIAAHESGHAIQDAQGYFMLRLRTTMVPTVQIGSWLGPIIFMIGLFMASTTGTSIAWAGLILFALTAVFAVITLPVELNASRRAKLSLADSGVLYSQEELRGVDKVLDAAALTYVAGAVQAISTILYYAFLLMGRRRR